MVETDDAGEPYLVTAFMWGRQLRREAAHLKGTVLVYVLLLNSATCYKSAFT